MSTLSQRPPSLLDKRRMDGTAMASGLLMAVVAHVLVPLLLAAVVYGVQALGGRADAAASRPRVVVEARFVKLGKIFDPRTLPNRRVPPRATAPRRDIVVSKNMNPRNEPPPDAGPRDPRAQPDFITRLAERVEAFAEIERQRELEGDPNGIAEGTETQARAGDLYAGQLYAFFRRGWTVPETIPQAEVNSLVTIVEVDVSQGATIVNVRVHTPSANPLFDQSVVNRIEDLQRANATLPEPPAEVASDYLGQTITLRFRGRDAR